MRFRLLIGVVVLLVVAGAVWIASSSPADDGGPAPQASVPVREPSRRSRPGPRPAPVPAATISGTVVSSGAPVAGATVTLRQDDAFQQVESGDDGAFLFEAVPAGYFAVAATLGAQSSELLGPLLLSAGQRREGLVLELHPGASVSGVVMDMRTRREIPNVVVRSSSGATVTDRAGRFTLGPLPANGTFLEASAQGYEPRVEWLTLDAARAHSGVELFLRATTSLKGKVTQQGAPVEGAQVWAEAAQLSAQSQRFGPVTTDADGAFTLGVAAGEFVLAAAGPGGARVQGPRLTVAEGGTYDGLQVELGEPAVARGTVTINGEPAQGVGLFLIDARSQQAAASTTTGPGGAFEFTGLSPGSYLVQVHTGTLVAQRGPFEVTGANDAPWTVDVQSGAVLKGRVEPARAGVTVRWRSTDWAGPFMAEASTDASGRFTFDGVPEGGVVVEAESPEGYARTIGTVGTEVVLHLSAATLTGVVLDDRGRSVSDFVVRARSLDGGAPRAQAVLNPDGQFQIAVPPGRYAVTASARGYGDSEPQQAEVSNGQSASNLKLVLQAAEAVRAQVVAAGDGATLPAVEVVVLRPRFEQGVQYDRWAAVTTDAQGRFEFASVPARSVLRFRKDGFRTLWLRSEMARNVPGGRIILAPGPAGNPEGAPPYEGVGMYLRPQPGRIFIEGVFDGGPAQLAGVLRDDELLAVDGVPVSGLPLDQVTSRIMGPSGTLVRLTFQRGDRVFDVVVRRRSIQL